MNTIKVGQTYQTSQGEYTCIYVKDGMAWMMYHCGANPAYVWHVDGTSNLDHRWDVIWDDPKALLQEALEWIKDDDITDDFAARLENYLAQNV